MYVCLVVHTHQIYIYIYGMSFVRPQHHNSIQHSSPPSPPDEPEESDDMQEQEDEYIAWETQTYFPSMTEDQYHAQTLRLLALEAESDEEELRGLATRGGELDGRRGNGMEGGDGPMGGEGGVGGKYHALRVPYIYIDTYVTYVYLLICICSYIQIYTNEYKYLFVHGLASTF